MRRASNISICLPGCLAATSILILLYLPVSFAATCPSVTIERDKSIPLGTCIQGGSSCTQDSQCGGSVTNYCMKGVCSNNPGAFCTSSSQCGGGSCVEDITFTFDKSYECGQFASGDWWIEADSNNKVIIDSMNPPHTPQCESLSSGCRNGYMKDPAPETAGYSSRHAKYDVRTPPLPLTIGNVDRFNSIVKSIDGGQTKNEGGPTQYVAMLFAGVLTIVPNGQKPSPNDLRPAYGGPKKMPALYNIGQINFNKIPKLPIAQLGDASKLPKIEEAIRYFGQAHVGFDMRNSSATGIIQAYQACRGYPFCYHSSHYHAARSATSGREALRLLMDDTDYDNNESHRKAIYGAIQAGIDRAWAARNWSGSVRIKDFLIPQLLAAALLGDNNLVDANFDDASEIDTFYDSPHYGPGHPADYMWGYTVPEHVYWQKSSVTLDAQDKWSADPYGYAEGTLEPFGGNYQHCCSMMPWKANALLVHLMQMEDIIDLRGFLHVSDRYHNGWQGTPSMAGGHFALGDPVRYESGPNSANSNTCHLTHSCTPKATAPPARNPSVHQKNGGGWGEDFGNEMWSSFRECADEIFAGVPSSKFPCAGMTNQAKPKYKPANPPKILTSP